MSRFDELEKQFRGTQLAVREFVPQPQTFHEADKGSPLTKVDKSVYEEMRQHFLGRNAGVLVRLIVQGAIEKKDVKKYCETFLTYIENQNLNQIIKKAFRDLTQTNRERFLQTLHDNVDLNTVLAGVSGLKYHLDISVLNETKEWLGSNSIETPDTDRSKPELSSVPQFTGSPELQKLREEFDQLSYAQLPKTPHTKVVPLTPSAQDIATSKRIVNKVYRLQMRIFILAHQEKDPLAFIDAKELFTMLTKKFEGPDKSIERERIKQAFESLTKNEREQLYNSLNDFNYLKLIIEGSNIFEIVLPLPYLNEIKKWTERNQTNNAQHPSSDRNVPRNGTVTEIERLRAELKKVYDGHASIPKSLKKVYDGHASIPKSQKYATGAKLLIRIIIDGYKNDDLSITRECLDLIGVLSPQNMNAGAAAFNREKVRDGFKSDLKKVFSSFNRSQFEDLFNALNQYGLAAKFMYAGTIYKHRTSDATYFLPDAWGELRHDEASKIPLHELMNQHERTILPQTVRHAYRAWEKGLIEAFHGTHTHEHEEEADASEDRSRDIIVVTSEETAPQAEEDVSADTNLLKVIEVERLLVDGDNPELGPTLPRARSAKDEDQAVRIQPRIHWVIDALRQDGFELRDMVMYKEREKERTFEDLFEEEAYQRARYRVLEVCKDHHYFQIAVAETVGKSTYIIRDPIEFSDGDPMEIAKLKRRPDVFQISCFSPEQLVRRIRTCAYTPLDELQEQLKTRINWADKKDAVTQIVGHYFIEHGSPPPTGGQYIVDMGEHYKFARAEMDENKEVLTTYRRLYQAIQNKSVAGLQHVRNFRELIDDILGPVSGRQPPAPKLPFDAVQVFKDAAHTLKETGAFPENLNLDEPLENRVVTGMEDVITGDLAHIKTTRDFLVAAGLAVCANDNRDPRLINPAPPAIVAQLARLADLLAPEV